MEVEDNVGVGAPVTASFESLAAIDTRWWIEAALDHSMLLGQRVSRPEQADVILSVTHSYEEKFIAIGMFCGLTLCLLPLPIVGRYDTFHATLASPQFQSFELPEVRREVQAWIGLPLILLSFLSVDEYTMRQEMCEELVLRAREGYTLHLREARRVAIATGDFRGLASFAHACRDLCRRPTQLNDCRQL